MSRISRDVPKAIANFGEQQFKDTGASLVEVLRVKEAVLRKHFRQLKGILFLVSVVSRDRVRVYFFNAGGIMVIGENLEVSKYEDIRKSSKIIAKFEKPRPLTPEEMRIEATQELRDALGKAIRRMSRALTLKEPNFPDIYVTRQEGEKERQSFGTIITDDGEIMFEESTVNKNWTEGLLLRTSFLLFFDHELWQSEYTNAVGNGVALSLLKGETRRDWLAEWKKRSKGNVWEPVVNHFSNHASTYILRGYSWISSLMTDMPAETDFPAWQRAIRILHDSLLVQLGTEEYHVITGFCNSLKNPQQLIKKRHLIDAIHLAPRVLCDPSALGIGLSIEHKTELDEETWAWIKYISGSSVETLQVRASAKPSITSIEYSLNLEDLFPLTGGPLSHGKAIINHALALMGLNKPIEKTFDAKLELNQRFELENKDLAVLERLMIGNISVLANSLVGSPLVIRNLVEKGVVFFVPNFNHVGIIPDYLLRGRYEDVMYVAHLAPEATIFKTSSEAHAIVSAPANWRRAIIERVANSSIALWPILETGSVRQIIRDEVIFPSGEGPYQWSDGIT